MARPWERQSGLPLAKRGEKKKKTEKYKIYLMRLSFETEGGGNFWKHQRVGVPMSQLSLQTVLRDVASRFLLNLPEDEKCSGERFFFHLQQAHWFYEGLWMSSFFSDAPTYVELYAACFYHLLHEKKCAHTILIFPTRDRFLL